MEAILIQTTTGSNHHAQILHVYWNSEHGPSCLYSKCFTSWTIIIPALRMLVTGKMCILWWMRGLHRECTLSSNSFTEQERNMSSTALHIDLLNGRWLMAELAEDMGSILITHMVFTIICNPSSRKSNRHAWSTHTCIQAKHSNVKKRLCSLPVSVSLIFSLLLLLFFYYGQEVFIIR